MQELINDSDFNSPAEIDLTALKKDEPKTDEPQDTTILDQDLPRYKTGKKAGQIKASALKKINPKIQESEANNTNPSTLLISGGLVIMVIDLIIPKLVAKFGKVNEDPLKLTDDQKKELIPLADNAFKSLNLTGITPMNLFIVSLFSIYATNFITLKLLSK